MKEMRYWETRKSYHSTQVALLVFWPTATHSRLHDCFILELNNQ